MVGRFGGDEEQTTGNRAGVASVKAKNEAIKVGVQTLDTVQSLRERSGVFARADSGPLLQLSSRDFVGIVAIADRRYPIIGAFWS